MKNEKHRYHINNAGQVALCKATVRACTFAPANNPNMSETVKTVDDVFTEIDKKTPKLSPQYDLRSIAPEWVDRIPAYPDGTDFETAWVETFEELQNWEKTNGDLTENTIDQLSNISNLLDDPPQPARPRGEDLETPEETEKETSLTVPKQYTKVLAVSTRLGGGNRECWCDDENNHHCYVENIEELESHPNFIGSEDDDFDSTYATYYYGITKTEQEIKTYEKNIEKARHLLRLKNKLNSVKNKQLAPWSALSNTYISYTRDLLDDAKIELKEAKKEKKTVENLLRTLKKGEYDTTLNKLSFKTWELDNLRKAQEETKEKKKELNRLQKTKKEAEALPDGELKTYLLADRGAKTFTTAEKRGRSTVAVKKTYQQGSRLGKEIDSAKSYYDNANKSLTSAAERAIKSNYKLKNVDSEVDRYQKTVEELTTKRQTSWENGWTDPNTPTPPIPKNY